MIYYFYKIVCDDLPEYVYVGSTMSYTNRKYEHKRSCSNENRKNYNCKIYQTIRANGGWNNWRMVCIHQQEVDNKRHAEQIEENYRVQLNGNMNDRRAFRTPEQYKEQRKEWDEQNKEQKKEWRKNNKESISEYKKEWYEQNKVRVLEQKKEYRETNKESIAEKSKEKIKCECGCEVRRDSLTRHKRSTKHIKLMQNI
jgi:hypothetical protein